MARRHLDKVERVLVRHTVCRQVGVVSDIRPPVHAPVPIKRVKLALGPDRPAMRHLRVAVSSNGPTSVSPKTGWPPKVTLEPSSETTKSAQNASAAFSEEIKVYM